MADHSPPCAATTVKDIVFLGAAGAEFGIPLIAYRDRPKLRRAIGRAMAKDFSWEGPARQYLRLYESALAKMESTGPLSGRLLAIDEVPPTGG